MLATASFFLPCHATFLLYVFLSKDLETVGVKNDTSGSTMRRRAGKGRKWKKHLQKRCEANLKRTANCNPQGRFERIRPWSVPEMGHRALALIRPSGRTVSSNRKEDRCKRPRTAIFHISVNNDRKHYLRRDASPTPPIRTAKLPIVQFA